VASGEDDVLTIFFHLSVVLVESGESNQCAYQTAPKGKYRVEGFAGFGRWGDPSSPENPQRFFEYVLPDGTLSSTVLQTSGIDIVLA